MIFKNFGYGRNNMNSGHSSLTFCITDFLLSGPPSFASSCPLIKIGVPIRYTRAKVYVQPSLLVFSLGMSTYAIGDG